MKRRPREVSLRLWMLRICLGFTVFYWKISAWSLRQQCTTHYLPSRGINQDEVIGLQAHRSVKEELSQAERAGGRMEAQRAKTRQHRGLVYDSRSRRGPLDLGFARAPLGDVQASDAPKC